MAPPRPRRRRGGGKGWAEVTPCRAEVTAAGQSGSAGGERRGPSAGEFAAGAAAVAAGPRPGLASLGAASGTPRLHLYCSVKRSAAYRRRAASVAAAVPPPSLHPLPRCAAGPSFAGYLPRAVPRQVEASPGLSPGLAYVCVFKTSVQTGLGKAREGCDGAAGASGRISSLVC